MMEQDQRQSLSCKDKKKGKPSVDCTRRSFSNLKTTKKKKKNNEDSSDFAQILK